MVGEQVACKCGAGVMHKYRNANACNVLINEPTLVLNSYHENKNRMVKNMRFGKLKRVICGLLAVGTMMVAVNQYIECSENQKDIAEKILRFHVRANSDATKDQELKLKVRDAVGEMMAQKLKDADDISRCREIVMGNMGEIVEKATDTIKECGYDYPVEAYVAEVDFPDKTYGEYTFPAGTYEALELVIGSGAGQNWWCVMYPNMCFAGSGYEVVKKDAKESLEQTLTQEEYESLMEEKNYTIKCKYLKFLNPCIEKLQEIF